MSVFAGSVEVPPDLMEELLQAADQYMLGSLKRLCEIAIADTLTVRIRTHGGFSIASLGSGGQSRPGDSVPCMARLASDTCRLPCQRPAGPALHQAPRMEQLR